MSTKRFRDRGSPDYDSMLGTRTRVEPGEPTTTLELEIPNANGHYGWMRDTSTPQFRKRIARGDIVINEMFSKNVSRSTSGDGESYQISDTNPTTYTNTIPKSIYNRIGLVSSRFIDMDLGNLRTIAGTKAWANVASPEVQGLVALAELRETVGFIRKPMSNLNNYLNRELRKAKKKRKERRKARLGDDYKAVPFRQHIADNWLGYRYGFRPLVSDLENAAQAVASLQFRKPPRLVARGKMDLVDEVDFEDSKVVGSFTTAQRVGKTVRTVNMRAGILYEHDHSDTFGMDLAQLPIAAWEVIPFSFVADWFVNVGDYIQAITPKLGVRIVGEWSSMVDSEVTTASSTGSQAPPRVVIKGATMEEVLTSETKTRWRTCPKGLTTHPAPFRGELGMKRIADSFALLNQLLAERV